MREKRQQWWTNISSTRVERENGRIEFFATRDYDGPLSPAEPSVFSTGVTIVTKDKKITEYMLYQTGINGFRISKDEKNKEFLKYLPLLIDIFLTYTKKYESELMELLNATKP